MRNDSKINHATNNAQWERRTGDWVEAQHKSNKRKEEADKLGMRGEERRKYIGENRQPRSGHQQ